MTSTDVIAQYAALLSLIEVALGSWLHGLHLPLSGQFLSLNQGFLLSQASLEARHLPKGRLVPVQISTVSAVLKSLSFAGKRLTPMLAIGMQGLLFNIGILLFGVTPVGLAVGMILLCLWAFIQPFLMYFLMFGDRFIPLAEFYLGKIQDSFHLEPKTLGLVLLNAVIIKLAVGLGLVALAYGIPADSVRQRLTSWIKKSGVRLPDPVEGSQISVWENLRRSAKDLLRPFVLLSLVLNAFFVYSLSLETVDTVIHVLRPVAIGLVGFYILRSGWILRAARQRFLLGRLTREAYAKAVALLQ